MSGGQREALLERITDHVLAEGLIGLTLRPVAAAVGTSDRMLVYHFGSRDQLISAVVARSGERAVAALDALPAADGVRDGINKLWRAYQQPPLGGHLNVYCQAAATGLIGTEPYLSVARDNNERWADALKRYLVRCGAAPAHAGRIVTLVDSALYGFHLDLTTDRPEELARGVDDLASAAASLT